MANLNPFQFLGSRLSLCFIASVIAWPLMFSIAATLKGMAVEPRPSEIAIGIGESIWAASYSLFSVLSRMTAQPAVLTTSTFRPCFAYMPMGCAMIMGVAHVIGMKPTFRLVFSGAAAAAKASAIV